MPITGITIEADSVVIKGSDFDALCAAAAENEQLRANLHRIRNQSLEWAMSCPHHCPACDAMYEAIKGSSGHPTTKPLEKA